MKMDLQGLDSQWRGFSDFDIKKVKDSGGSRTRSVKGRAREEPDPPPSGSPPRHPLEVATVMPPQSSIHDDHTPSTMETVSAEDQDKDDSSELKTAEDKATPPEQKMPTQQPEMLTQQEAPVEAELNENLSPAQKALQLKRQKEIEEENKKKKQLVEKTLKERYSMTQQESERLKKVHADLASLDKLVTRDVGILRDKIETANLEHNRARVRYELAEKEFISAKLELHRTKEEKELLSEHLCTIIHQTELRKAKKLAQLCQALGVDETLDQ